MLCGSRGAGTPRSNALPGNLTVKFLDDVAKIVVVNRDDTHFSNGILFGITNKMAAPYPRVRTLSSAGGMNASLAAQISPAFQFRNTSQPLGTVALSAVNIFIKDLGIVLDSAKKATFPLPITAASHQMFLMAGAAGFGQEDDSAVVKVYQQLSGITLPTKRTRARPSARPGLRNAADRRDVVAIGCSHPHLRSAAR